MAPHHPSTAFNTAAMFSPITVPQHWAYIPNNHAQAQQKQARGNIFGDATMIVDASRPLANRLLGGHLCDSTILEAATLKHSSSTSTGVATIQQHRISQLSQSTLSSLTLILTAI